MRVLNTTFKASLVTRRIRQNKKEWEVSVKIFDVFTLPYFSGFAHFGCPLHLCALDCSGLERLNVDH
jgi:hypothetical protein